MILVRGSIVVSIPACHAGNRGSIPRRGVIFFFLLFSNKSKDTMSTVLIIPLQCDINVNKKFFLTKVTRVNMNDKQRGAVEACWAHNSEVGRSKLLAASLSFYILLNFSFGLNKTKREQIYNTVIRVFYLKLYSIAYFFLNSRNNLRLNGQLMLLLLLAKPPSLH